MYFSSVTSKPPSRESVFTNQDFEVPMTRVSLSKRPKLRSLGKERLHAGNIPLSEREVDQFLKVKHPSDLPEHPVMLQRYKKYFSLRLDQVDEILKKLRPLCNVDAKKLKVFRNRIKETSEGMISPAQILKIRNEIIKLKQWVESLEKKE